MKRKSISTASPPSDDAPQITKAFFEKGEHLIAGKKVSKAEWQIAARAVQDAGQEARQHHARRGDHRVFQNDGR